MRKNVLLSMVCLALLAMSAFAQEKEAANPAMPSPPKPLTDELFQWMVGEWEGTTASAEGKSQDWQKVEMSLDNQFVTTHYSAQIVRVMSFKWLGDL